MKIKTWDGPKRTDVPEAPSWLDRILDPIIIQIKDITAALIKGLSFLSNFNAEIRTISVRHEVPADIVLQDLAGKPQMAFLGAIGIDDYARLKWNILDAKSMRVTISFASAPTNETLVTLLILSGSP